jgi:hypothetical protein
MSDEPAAPDEQESIVMIGPKKTGKSCFVAALDRACSLDDPVWNVVFQAADTPPDRTSQKFIEDARMGILGERPPCPATAEPVQYTFSIELKNKQSNRTAFKKNLVVVDAPGEAEITDNPGGANPAIVSSLMNKIIENGRKALGAIFFVDPLRPNLDREFYLGLPGFLARVPKETISQWKRIAVTVPKADSVFLRCKHRARLLAEHADPNEALRLMVDDQSRKLLADVFHGAEIVSGWTSAYGFTREGQSNYNPGSEGLLVAGEGASVADIIHNWVPFQVLDILVFLITGERRKLRAYSAR